MKQKLTQVAVFLLFFTPCLRAQTTFSVQHDTVSSAPLLGVSTTIDDGINATTGTTVISWKVVASDFPADWIAAYSICDNYGCYPATSLWSQTSGTLAAETSHPYGISPVGSFHLLVEFNSLNSTGCHFVTVRMNNQSIPVDVGYETYLICNNGTSGISGSIKSPGEVMLYPNPAHDDISIVYDPGYDVRNVIVYNIIGKVMAAYKVSNSSASLNLEHIPPGLYFVRLLNSNGTVVATKKFTKQ